MIALDAVVAVVRIDVFTIREVLRYMGGEGFERGLELPSSKFSQLQILAVHGLL